MRKLINRFRRDEEGAALVEYGMLVGLIAVICIAAVTLLGQEISTAFSSIASALAGAAKRFASSGPPRRLPQLFKEHLRASVNLRRLPG
jgi:pilus assembly protein Flp/PilA